MSFLKHLLPAWNRDVSNKTKTNDAILASFDKELTATEQEAIQSKIQSSLKTSGGEWLDTYGAWFGLPRKELEEDEDYRARIIRYVLVRKGTIPAIIVAIRDFLDDYTSHIEIYEPFNNVFMLNRSLLNGEDHLMGEYYTFAVIDIKMTDSFPLGLVDIINEFKPAGVRVVLTPFSQGEVDTSSVIDIDTLINSTEGLGSMFEVILGKKE